VKPLQQGFTLIELIMFVVVAAIFIPCSFIAFSWVTGSIVAPERITNARFIAEQAMELALARDYVTQLEPVIGTAQSCTGLGVALPTGYSCTWAPTYATLDVSPYSNNCIQIFLRVTEPQGFQYDAYGLVKRP
jgi:type II secretory pathway pseudopilin PulG